MGEGEEVVRWQSMAGEPGVELLWAERSTRLWRWYHETYSLCTITTGPAQWAYRGKQLWTRPGETMMMEPGEVHDSRRLPRGFSTFRVVLLSPILVENIAVELGAHRPHLVGGNVADPRVFHSLVSLHRAVEEGATVLERDSRLAECVRHLLTSCAERPAMMPTGRETAAVRRARDHLHERWAEGVSLSELAAAAGVSRFRLLRAFSRELGLTPHAYLIRLRVERARSMLATGMSVAAVALATGFADQSHLTRHFKRVCGVPPAAYVAQRRSVRS